MSGDLRQWRHVEAVYRLRSFHLAAEEHHITQSALSKSISVLETLLGIMLFERSTRRVTPTPEMERLTPLMQRFLSSASDMEQEARFIRSGDKGEIWVGTTATPAAALIKPAIDNLKLRTPHLRVNVIEAGSVQLFQKLFSGEVEMIVQFGNLSVDHPSPEQLNVEILPRETNGLLFRRGHPIEKRKKDLISYAKYPWLAHHLSSDFATNFPEPFRSYFAKIPVKSYFISDIEERLSMLENSDVLALFPRALAMESCKVRQLSFQQPPFPIYSHYLVLSSKSTPMSPSAELFRSVMHETSLELSRSHEL